MKFDIELTKNQVKQFQWYRGFTSILLDHAVVCTERRCMCKGSIFNDTLAGYQFHATDSEKRIIEEILQRDMY